MKSEANRIDLIRRWSYVAKILGAVLLLEAGVQAQVTTPVGLSFDQALVNLTKQSDALAAAQANVRGKQDLSLATRHLRWPEISIETRGVLVRKTLELEAGSLAPLAESLGLPTAFRVVDQQFRIRPILTAVGPIYTGGRISAAQGAAVAAVRQAESEREIQSQSLVVQLVHAYFGQQLAELALAVRTDVRDGLQQHLEHTEALEQQGFATRAQRLQAVVARDQAERDFQKAVNDVDTAQAQLANILHSDQRIVPATRLFVISSSLGSSEEFRRDVLSRHPQIARLRAIRDQSIEAVRVQQAALKPEAFAFAQHDVYRNDASLADPDWAIGAGVKYVLFSGSGRRDRVSAARQQQIQVEAGIREIGMQLEIGIIDAYNDLETARRQYLLLDSSIAQAEENVRLQDLSFREGQATSLDVIDARLGLGRAQIERAQAAFQFTSTLARLLDVSGQAGRFTDYIIRADKVVQP